MKSLFGLEIHHQVCSFKPLLLLNDINVVNKSRSSQSNLTTSEVFC